ncbi:hypothetical protein ABZP36_006772 [Zizania latifolia]
MLDTVAAVVDELADIHTSQPPGDVLVFLPEKAHIIDVHAKLEQLNLPVLAVRCIHDNIPGELMCNTRNAPVPDGSRRVVLATDVVETAVLVSGITYVLDSGLVSEQPPVIRTSKETAAGSRARAGTAGFSGPGICHRLYQQDEYDDLDEHTVPHIR